MVQVNAGRYSVPRHYEDKYVLDTAKGRIVNACRECGKPRQGHYHYYCSREHKEQWETKNLPPVWGYVRNEVLKRDGYRCVRCGVTQKEIERRNLSRGEDGRWLGLEIDHIKPVRLFPELEFDRANLRTLCHDCHVDIGERPSAKSVRRRDAFRHMRTLAEFGGIR